MPDRVEPFTPGTDVFSGVEFSPQKERRDSPDSLTGRLYRDLSLVEKGLCDQSLFPRVDIRSAMALGTFARVKASKQVADLVRIFADAELQASVGFNVGTCEISLTVPLPVSPRPFLWPNGLITSPSWPSCMLAKGFGFLC
eukprot:1071838-Rhodomonas_salina.1